MTAAICFVLWLLVSWILAVRLGRFLADSTD